MESDTLVGKAVKYLDDNSNENFAEVLGLGNGYFKCRDLIKPEDTKVGRHIYCGDRELYRGNNFFDIIQSNVKESYPLVTLQDYPSSRGFLVRQFYYENTKSFNPEKLPPVCLCQQPLNPDVKFTICQKCNQIFHDSCLTDFTSCPDCSWPFKRQRVDVLDLDSPKKQQKSFAKARTVDNSSLPIDVDKYKILDEESKERLLENVMKTHNNFLSLKSSLSNEEKIRQQLICKIIYALYLSIEENKQAKLSYPISELEKKAMEIEAALYYSTGNNAGAPAYKGKVRSLLFNLCDEKNPDFRFGILKGDFDAKEVSKMQSKDMASSAIKNFRQERQKKYTEENLVLPESGEKLMVKTRKGEAVISINEGLIADETSTDLLDLLLKKTPKKVEEGKNGGIEEDPFNPESYTPSKKEARNEEGTNQHIYEIAKDWMPKPLMNKLKETLGHYLEKEQSNRVLSRIKFLSSK
ncbi:unnamed protein product [Blepharisma stoltei]|uniref:TFIIS central domain-containing protein n=1 Tax=Blepharisma stoltei TaxID=1481888 RepID=A0AAU9K4A3_9CILI|nr:unnamed protein product [Blepharisma stoltei]